MSMSKFASQADYWKDRAEKAEQALEAMRLLAAEPHYIDKVRQALGPLSLWDKQSLDAMVERKFEEALKANGSNDVGESTLRKAAEFLWGLGLDTRGADHAVALLEHFGLPLEPTIVTKHGPGDWMVQQLASSIPGNSGGSTKP